MSSRSAAGQGVRCPEQGVGENPQRPARFGAKRQQRSDTGDALRNGDVSHDLNCSRRSRGGQ